MRGQQPIWDAYSEVGALEVPCGHCGAPVGTWCTADDGRRLRRVPCISRCKSDSWATSRSAAVVHTGRDYSEPLHQPD